jgi:hypothetical protein
VLKIIRFNRSDIIQRPVIHYIIDIELIEITVVKSD